MAPAQDYHQIQPLLEDGSPHTAVSLKSRVKRYVDLFWPFLALSVLVWTFHFFRRSNLAVPKPILRYHPAGLVSGSVNQTHPILTLIEQGQQRWQKKLDSQSRNLTAAVAEYKRRYRRPPPRGFDRWYAWAESHHVELRDEFDLLAEQLQPFFAVPPRTLRRRIRELPNRMVDVSLIGITDREVEPDGSSKNEYLGNIKRRLLDPIAEQLEDVVVAVNYIDHARMVTEWDVMAEHLEAAERGELLDDDWLPPLRQLSPTGVCPPLSRTRQEQGDLLPESLTFIGDDWKPAFNVCDNPALLHTHTRMFKLPNEQASPWCRKRYPSCTPLTPVLSYSPISAWGDIGVPTWSRPYHDGFRTGDGVPFERKKYRKAAWRGLGRGTWNEAPTKWREGQRPRLHMLTHRNTTGMQRIAHFADDEGKVIIQQTSLETLNDFYFDLAVVNEPTQCHNCREMQKWLDETHAPANTESAWIYHYQYLVDVDGNGWSGRMKQLMASNACVLKATIIQEWFRDRIQPWVHFVPLRVDYEDIYDIMTFFVGNSTGGYNHTALAAQIARSGQDWNARYYRDEDAQAYGQSVKGSKRRDFLILAQSIAYFWRWQADNRNTTIYDPPSPAPVSLQSW